MGEFGAYSKADYESRIRWNTEVTSLADSLNISWAYWEFCSGFGLYNTDTGWDTTLLHSVLSGED